MLMKIRKENQPKYSQTPIKSMSNKYSEMAERLSAIAEMDCKSHKQTIHI